VIQLLWVLLGIAVLGGVAVAATGGIAGLRPAVVDRPEPVLPPDRSVQAPDVDALRFAVGLRGYRMDQVDDVLDRLAAELQAKDERIAELEQAGRPAEAAEASGRVAGDG